MVKEFSKMLYDLCKIYCIRYSSNILTAGNFLRLNPLKERENEKKRERENLAAAVASALESGSFSKLNIVERAKNVVLFGTGRFFEEALEPWKLKERLHVTYVCDNNPQKWGQILHGLPCISPEELASLPDVVAIPLVGQTRAIENQLDAMGVPRLNFTDWTLELLGEMPRSREWFAENRILDVYDMLEDDLSRSVYASVLCRRIAPQYVETSLYDLFTDDEYFAHGFFTLGSEDVFLDCGAYNGDTVKRFLEAAHHRFRAVHAFEIAPGNYAALLDAVSALPEEERCKIRCHNAGVWDDDKGFVYGKEELGPEGSFSILKTDHQARAQTVRLDTLAEAEGLTEQTLIKMAIEGAELRALKGAENFLRRCKPKLAVCLYHRLEDFWAIPTYLKSVRPDYRFGVRHHSDGEFWGTVLYAW